MILAKLALGTVGTLAFATAYTFHEGTIRVDVDEHRPGGSHVHFWVPAAAVPAAMHLVPDDKLQQAIERSEEFIPVAQAVVDGLQKYPDAEFVRVDSEDEHVRVSVKDGKIYVDVQDHGDDVHVAVPVSTIKDILQNIADRKHAQ